MLHKYRLPQCIVPLCCFLHIGLDHVGHSGDELAIGGFATAGGDGVAEILFQHIQITTAPGHFDEMADGSLKIPFIGIFMA